MSLDEQACSAGACELPPRNPARATATPTLLYVTDPLCSGCWAFEPAWRKLRHRYADVVSVRTIYGGLLPGWDGFSDPGAGIAAPADVAPHWEQVAAASGQPILPDVWQVDPPSSSFPASKAAHIARMLDPALEDRFLRRVREAAFIEARNIARRGVLIACAQDAGLDARAFSILYDADAGAYGFAEDLRERERLGVFRFPTVLVSAGDRLRPLAVGARPWAELESALLNALPSARPMPAPTVEEALRAYGSGTTLEFATLLERAPADAEAQLEAAGAARRDIGGRAIWTAG
jgi:putative protein-disulfide isomerase